MSRLQLRVKCLQCQRTFQVWYEAWATVVVGDILTARCVLCKEETAQEVLAR